MSTPNNQPAIALQGDRIEIIDPVELSASARSWELHKQGMSNQWIADRIGIERRKVVRFIHTKRNTPSKHRLVKKNSPAKKPEESKLIPYARKHDLGNFKQVGQAAKEAIENQCKRIVTVRGKPE